MPKNTQNLLLTIIGILILAATYTLTRALSSETTALIPLIPLLLALTTALLLNWLTHTQTAPASLTTLANRLTPYTRHLLLLTSAALWLYLLWKIPQLRFDQDSYTHLLLVWAAAYLIFLTAIWQKNPTFPSSLLTTHYPLITLTLVALALRLYNLDTLPLNLSGDEAEQGMQAVSVIQNRLRNPFYTGWLGVPMMSFFYNSLSIRALGQTIFALRLPWMLIGTATVPLAYFLAKELFQSRRYALTTAALVATYHYHIHFSRLGSNQIADGFFLTLALWLYALSVRNQRRELWALCGGAVGLAFYFYAGARLTLIIILALIIYQLLCEKRAFWQIHKTHFLVFLASFTLVAGPMLQFAILNWNEFNARLNQVGIFQSGWFEQEIANGRTPFDILTNQFFRAFLAFNWFPDRTVWYGLDQPLLDPLFGILFLVGLLFGTIQVFRFKNYALAPIIAWWWGGMLTAGFLTAEPPNSQRLITLAVPTCFLIALTIRQLTTKYYPLNTIHLLLTTLFTIISLNTYFFTHPPYIAGGTRAEFATLIAKPLAQIVPETRVHFVGAPFMYWGFGTLDYLVGEPYGNNIEANIVTPDFLAGLAQTEQDFVFVIMQERWDDYATILEVFPDGEEQKIYSGDGRLLGVIYDP